MMARTSPSTMLIATPSKASPPPLSANGMATIIHTAPNASVKIVLKSNNGASSLFFRIWMYPQMAKPRMKAIRTRPMVNLT